MDAGELRVVLLIAAGGALGSVARYLLGSQFGGSGFPWGTAVVNLTGCFAMGALFFWAAAGGSLSNEARAFLFVGVLGGFTTMSAFSLDTAALWEKGEAGAAALYAGLSFGGCLGAVWVGRALGMAVAR